MRSIKKYFLFMVAFNLVVIAGFGYYFSTKLEISYEGLMVREIATFEELLDHSPLVVEVMKTGRKKDLTIQHAELTLSEVKIKQVLRGDSSLKNKMIQIIQLREINLNDHERGNRFVLFLTPHRGNITENGYFVTGVYQGKFEIDANNKLVYRADQHQGIKTFQDNVAQLTVTDLKRKIQSHLKS